MKPDQLTCPHTDLHVGVCYGDMVVECTNCLAFVSLDNVEHLSDDKTRQAITEQVKAQKQALQKHHSK